LFIYLFIYFVEAGTELSDLERRVRGLREQLRKKKNEAEKLRQEQQRKKKEQLRIKEQSLLKQIHVRNNVSYSHCKPQTYKTAEQHIIF
jgi:hypothetical protein